MGVVEMEELVLLCTMVVFFTAGYFVMKKLDRFFDPHHPAILAMIRMVVENAHKAGIWAGICGELGADTSLTKEFLAMGVDELSVSAGSILPIRKIILETDLSQYGKDIK